MAVAYYRGFYLQSTHSIDIWEVQIKKHKLRGNLAAVKKSIDWFCDTATIINPKEFEPLGEKRERGLFTQECFNGFIIKNDTGQPNDWYCFIYGRLVKGSKFSLQRYISSYIVAKEMAIKESQKKRTRS